MKPILLLTFLLYPFISFTQDSLIVHEWGTFTTLQSSDGTRLNGLQRDEEKLPPFVHAIALLYTTDTIWDIFDKGWGYRTGNSTLLNVNVKMETPVLYFYSKDTKQITVDVQFKGGSISQWYPQREDGEFHPQVELLDFNARLQPGWIRWNATVLHPSTPLTVTSKVADETPQWVRPRATQSNLVKVDGQVEKFLFYRGIGNFDVPLHIQFNDRGDLVLTNSSFDKIGYILIHEKKKGQAAKVWWSGSLDPRYIKVVSEPMHRAEKPPGAMEHFTNALVSAGLYQDEAIAMLNTWRESYFEREGLKVFWILSRSATDEILPISINPAPDDLQRVIVGRSEILTPDFEQELMWGTDEDFHAWYGEDKFYLAYLELRAKGITNEWISIYREGEIPEQFSVRPNPFNNLLSISGRSETNLPVNISMFNLMGQRIFTERVHPFNQIVQEDFTLSNLMPGIYLLTINDGINRWHTKIVKSD